jgi:tetratricopeptide (TPR) repeat protein
MNAKVTTNILPLPQSAEGNVQGTNVMGASDVQPKHSGTFYDSDALVPDSALSDAGVTGPRKVDPALEPGQKYIVVDRTSPSSSYEAQYIAGTRALKLGRYTAAMEIFEILYAKNRKDPRILFGLAIAQQKSGFYESAAQTYEDVLRIDPDNADAIINLTGLMREQYPSVSLRKLMDLRDKYPNNVGIPAQIALINAQMNNHAEALRYLEIASSMDPRNASHVFNMAVIADRAGMTKKAIQLYERVLEMDVSYSDKTSDMPREQIYDRLVDLRRKI